MNIARTEKFKKAWDKLDQEDKTHGRKAIQTLLINIRNPGLRIKKIQGTRDIWEARASHSLRITFEITSETIVLRNIGHHDKTLNNP